MLTSQTLISSLSVLSFVLSQILSNTPVLQSLFLLWCQSLHVQAPYELFETKLHAFCDISSFYDLNKIVCCERMCTVV